MAWDDLAEMECSIARTLFIIGDRWTMLIVRELFLGTRRFDAFQANTGMSSNLLTQRLGRLVDEGVIERVRYQENPPRYEYRLTECGIALYPILIALKQWGDEWGFEGRRREATKLRHKGCGRMMSPVITLSCSACGEEIGPRDVRVVDRPRPVAPRDG